MILHTHAKFPISAHSIISAPLCINALPVVVAVGDGVVDVADNDDDGDGDFFSAATSWRIREYSTMVTTLQDNIVNTDRSYTHEELARISMRSWVSEVKGKATGIDHLKKELTVNQEYRVTYDILILATGEQYQVCTSTKWINRIADLSLLVGVSVRPFLGRSVRPSLGRFVSKPLCFTGRLTNQPTDQNSRVQIRVHATKNLQTKRLCQLQKYKKWKWFFWRKKEITWLL